MPSKLDPIKFPKNVPYSAEILVFFIVFCHTEHCRNISTPSASRYCSKLTPGRKLGQSARTHEVLLIVLFFIVFFCRTEHVDEKSPTPSASRCCSNMLVGLVNPPGDTNLNTSVKHQHQHQQQRTPSNFLVAYTEQIADTSPIRSAYQQALWLALGVTRRPWCCLAPG